MYEIVKVLETDGAMAKIRYDLQEDVMVLALFLTSYRALLCA